MKDTAILVVEDEAIIRLLIVSYLRAYGIEKIYETDSGEEALAIVTREKPDLVLMDVQIHGPIDGLETAQMMAQISEIPVILTSAYDYKETVANAAPPNIKGFIEKPISEKSIKTTLQSLGADLYE